MNIRKKSNLVMMLLIILIISSIITINYLKSRINPQEELMKCVAGKSHLYVSKTCSFCAQQKIILGDYIEYFNITDCLENTAECISRGITKWPAWEIENKTYLGLRSIEELKEIAGC